MTKEEASDQTPNYQLESTDPARNEQPNNPLHGAKLADILEYLVEMYGWDELGIRLAIRCFNNDPSVKSSLKFLRRTPWARKKVERLYIAIQNNE